MKAKEVHAMGDSEVAVELKNLRTKLFDLRSQAVTQKVEDTSQFLKIRRDIARLLTEQTRRRTAKA
jgi:large subunit ribosomal protein L29